MIDTIIIEDEQESMHSLRYLLDNYCPEINIVGMAPSLKEGYELIKNTSFELGLLDIDLPDGNIFDLLEKVTPIDFHTVFITGYDEYAVKAFRLSAIDYLLKPVNIQELKAAVRKTREEIEKKSLAEKINFMLEGMQSARGFDRIALPTSDGIHFANIKDIIWCRSDGNYTIFYLTNNQKQIISKTLKEFEELLSEAGFTRVHNSHLINNAHVDRYIKGKGGIAVMSNGDEVEISVRRKKEFLEKFNPPG